MNWQPTLSWQNAQKRAVVLQKIRAFFAERKVIEVETPALSQGTVTDVYLDAFECQYNFLADSSSERAVTLFLQTSPEFHMKRLLASGYGCIFQIAKAFRHEESGNNHNPEFTLLEWYRIGFDQFDLMHEVAELLKVVLGGNKALFTSYQDIFIKTVSVDPLIANFDVIEPTIGIDEPQFVYDFPVAQASLANRSIDDPRVAQRFECYFKGIELVNGFNELTDATEQVARFEEDNAKRKVQGLVVKPIDKNFIAALKHGLPQCSGVALGVDRLVMLALDIKKISEVQSFSIERA